MKIILKQQQATNFSAKWQYNVTESGSNDGMRRGYTHSVSVVDDFFFSNEEEVKDGFAYDLQVIRQEAGQKPYDLAADEATFRRNFDTIYRRLQRERYELLSHVACRTAQATVGRLLSCDGFAINDDEKVVSVQLGRGLVLAEDGDTVFTYAEYMEFLHEHGDGGRQLWLARALGDDSLHGREVKIIEGSIPEGAEWQFTLPKVTLPELLAAGRISVEDVNNTLLDYAERIQTVDRYIPIRLDGLEQYVLALPREAAQVVLGHCDQNAATLDLLRQFCPRRIDWREVPLAEMLESDLDLLIQAQEHAYTDNQWLFLQQCMEKPELEQKIVANASVLVYDYLKLGRYLRQARKVDLFRSISQHLLEHNERIDFGWAVKPLSELGCEGMERRDYDACLELVHRLTISEMSEREQMAAYVLAAGVTAGVEAAELERFLREEEIAGRKTELLSSPLRYAYRELNFAPGLAWLEAEEARKAAEAQRRTAEQDKSNDKVVRYVQQSGKMAICVKASASYERDAWYVESQNGDEIGRLKAEEKRVLFVTGRINDYLIDVERAKRVRGSVLHIDIYSDDAGYVIGSKGAKIKETTERLRNLGCTISNIRIHRV